MGISKYDSMGDWAELANGDRFYPILRDECSEICKKSPINTAYIGSIPDKDWGMAFGGNLVDDSGDAPVGDAQLVDANLRGGRKSNLAPPDPSVGNSFLASA